MKNKFQINLLSVIFVIFVVFVILTQHHFEKRLAIEKMCDKLELCCDIISSGNFNSPVLPDPSLCITIFDAQKNARYDSRFNIPGMTWNFDTPELIEAAESGTGHSFRRSAVDGKMYFFFAKRYDNFYVRIGQSYEKLSDILDTNYLSYIIEMLLFIIALSVIYFIIYRFGRNINIFKDFIDSVSSDNKSQKALPQNEFTGISEQFVDMYKDLERTQKALELERDKLNAHLKISNTGLAIFSPQRMEILSNDLFIQHINRIADHSCRYPAEVFNLREFEEIRDFFDSMQTSDLLKVEAKRIQITKNDAIMAIIGLVFPDKSVEITIEDITKQEEQSILKRQLTQNISHELKTPVSSIQGYMETLLNTPDIDDEHRQFFIQRSYTQAVRLTSLLQDISMLNKLDEASGIFAKDMIDIRDVINGILKDLALEIEEKHFNVTIDAPEKLPIEGNTSLMYSIFRNLMDNALHYAGTDIDIVISCYRSDENYYYFSFSDNGQGVADEHLNRLFDRFYRVDKGRSRKMGGTGLGLAIVKNSVIFHHGRISAKHHQGGGLEFLFTLKKTM